MKIYNVWRIICGIGIFSLMFFETIPTICYLFIGGGGGALVIDSIMQWND